MFSVLLHLQGPAPGTSRPPRCGSVFPERRSPSLMASTRFSPESSKALTSCRRPGQPPERSEVSQSCSVLMIITTIAIPIISLLVQAGICTTCLCLAARVHGHEGWHTPLRGRSSFCLAHVSVPVCKGSPTQTLRVFYISKRSHAQSRTRAGCLAGRHLRLRGAGVRGAADAEA